MTKWIIRILDFLVDFPLALDALVLSLFQKAQDRLALSGYRTATIARVFTEATAFACFMSVTSHALLIRKAPVLGAVCIFLAIFYCILCFFVASGLYAVASRNERGMSAQVSSPYPRTDIDRLIRTLYGVNTTIFLIICITDLFTRHQSPLEKFDDVAGALSPFMAGCVGYLVSLRYDPPTPPAPPIKGVSTAH